jgi:hypothetical protein
MSAERLRVITFSTDRRSEIINNTTACGAAQGKPRAPLASEKKQ